MKERIETYLSKVVNKVFKFKVVGKENYYQVFIESGQPINMESFRHAIEDYTDDVINIDCSCVSVSLWDEEGEADFVGGFCLMIEVYW